MLLKLLQNEGTAMRPANAWRVHKFRRPPKSKGPCLTEADEQHAISVAKRLRFKDGHATLLLVGNQQLRRSWIDHIDEAYAVDAKPLTI
jgi:hypothetical protein